MEEDKVLKGMIADILFNQENLEEFKRAIEKVGKGLNTPKQFRDLFVKKREKEINQLYDIFDFYFKQQLKRKDIVDFTHDNNNHQLVKELQERNQFFEQVRSRVGVIYEKLRESQAF